MKQLVRDYPNVSPWFCELVLDFCLQTDQAELDRLMETGELDKKPSKFSQDSVQKMLASYNKQS